MAKVAIKDKRKAIVNKVLEQPAKREKAPIFTLHKRAVDTGIPDLAENYKYYLYGGRSSD